jgi:hypothetical protein
VSHELNAIIVAPPIVSIALKVLIWLVLGVVRVVSPQRPLPTRVVLVVGNITGHAGTMSNTT